MPTSVTAAAVLSALVMGGAGAGAAGPAPLTKKERAGRVLYHEGRSPSGGAVNALVAGTSLSAEQVTCAGCHGDDGLGRPEGGVTPTPITWGDLTKPWGRTLDSGRQHPPYDDRTLARAVTDGVDSAGNPLQAAMPRYSMSRADTEALVAYMKRLGNEPVPGVGHEEARIGTVVPAKGPFAELGRAIRGTLDAWVAETNAAGGIHGRRVALHVAAYDPDREGGLEAAKALLARKDLLALVSGFTPAVEAELADLAEKQGVPLVGPFTPWPAGEDAGRARVFYLLGGPREQARVLAAHALREGAAGAPVTVLHVDDVRHAEPARTAAERLRAGGGRPELVPYARGRLDVAAVARIQEKGSEWVLFVGEDPDLSDFLRGAAAREWTPRVLACGSLSGRAALTAPNAFQGKVVLAMPNAPADETPEGRAALERAARRSGSGERFRSARASAWAAAQVLGEGMRRAGRAVSRERLASSLEALSGFETGLLPPLSYGPVRRVGAAGAWLVTADVEAQAFRPMGGFTPLD
ncbi:MAG TPA: ABC transporter substrate-binding protein [Anaeromyxobacter sp.]|nr:ABC transporter substrate-binding protein [Anaeromyxobacter sp.]